MENGKLRSVSMVFAWRFDFSNLYSPTLFILPYIQPYTHEEICKDEFELYSCPPSIKSSKDKVSLCHRTASKKNPWIQLEVSQSAVPAHLDHGDFIGDCNQVNDPNFIAPTPNFQSNKDTTTTTSTTTTTTKITNNDKDKESSNRQLASGGACVKQDPNCSKIHGGCRPKVVISGVLICCLDVKVVSTFNKFTCVFPMVPIQPIEFVITIKERPRLKSSVTFLPAPPRWPAM